MSLASGLMSFFLRRAQNRDGVNPALEHDALAASRIAEALPDAELSALPPRPGRDDLIASVLAEKVLAGWSANRNQTLHPLTLNVSVLSQAQAELMMQVAASCLLAGRELGEAQMRRARQVLANVRAADVLIDTLPILITAPMPFHELLASIRAQGLAGHAFALALRIGDPDDAAAYDFARYLATKLSLPPQMSHSLERRYRN